MRVVTKAVLALFLLGVSMSGFANPGPGPIPKLPGHLDPDDLDPACLDACVQEYRDNWRRCCGTCLGCKLLAQEEFEACIGNCLTD